MKKYYSLATLLLILFSTLVGSQMLENPFYLHTEKKLTSDFNSEITDFWEKNAVFHSFNGVNNKQVSTVSLLAGNSNVIVISQGRNESVLKYKELAFELSQQGYDLYLIDHRGQGFSERLGGDSDRGHVENFQNYVDDFNTYISSLELESRYQHRYLLSHSMGGTINALYLEQFKHPFQASAFFSPMFLINLNGLPNIIAKIITYSSAQICDWFTSKACYVFAGGPYQNKKFIGNELTSSETRFHLAQASFINSPETQLGDPTMRWVATSISATEQAIEEAGKITIPLLIIEAGADNVVSRKGQKQFYKNVTKCKSSQFLTISDAKHEILTESDRYRMPALTATLNFFINQQQGKLKCTK